MKILMCVVLLQGCTVYGGVGIKHNDPMTGLENPIGIVGGKAEFLNKTSVFIEHHSGIFSREGNQEERSYGYNLVGIKYEYKLF